MKSIFLFVCLALCAATVGAQTVTNGQNVNTSGTGNSVQCVNDTTTGTTVNRLAKIASTGCINATTSDTNIPVYIVTGGAGTSGSAQLSVSGQASCVMDSTIASGAEGYFVVASMTTADECDAQSALPTGVYIIGTLISGSTTAGSTAIVHQVGSFNPASSFLCSTVAASDTLTNASITTQQTFASQCAIPANTLVTGRPIKVFLGADTNQTTGPIWTFKASLCTGTGGTGTCVPIYTTPAANPSSSLTGVSGAVNLVIVPQAAAGSSVALNTSVMITPEANSGGVPFSHNTLPTSQSGFATNGILYLNFFLTFSSTTGTNNMTITNLLVQ